MTAADASASQIKSTLAYVRVCCRVSAAENPGLEHRSVDLISVTRNPHWFDLPRFYSQTSYALIGGGVLAAWGWGRCHIGARIDAIIATLSRDILGPYWPAQRTHIDDACSSIDFPYDCISVPRFEIRARWRVDGIVGHLRTWSAAQRHARETGHDPVDAVQTILIREWGDPDGLPVVAWPTHPPAGHA